MTVLFRARGDHESEETPTKRNCEICWNILLWDGFVHGMWHFKCKLYKLHWFSFRISYFRSLHAHPSIGLHWLLIGEGINFRFFSKTLKALLNGRLTEKLFKKTLKDNTCNNQTRLRSAGDNDRGSSAMPCVKIHVRDSQNARDQITSDRRFKRAWSNCVTYIPYIRSGSPN